MNYSETDVFSYRVSDGRGGYSEIVSVNIDVLPVNDPPEVLSQSLSVSEDSQLAIGLSGSDSDGNLSTYEIVSLPALGELRLGDMEMMVGDTLAASELKASTLNYIASSNLNGVDVFSYRIIDGDGLVS